MNILTRARGATVLLVLVALAALAATPAQAGNPNTGRIDLKASLEPADLAPGGTGLLVVEGTLLPDQEFKGRPLEGHHIYASGEQAMIYAPVQADGVTYDMDSVEFSEPVEKTDEFGDTLKVWKKHFTFKVKVSLAADTAPGTKLGVRFTYWGCTLGKMAGCYAAVKDHEASVALPGVAVIASAKPKIQLPPPSSGGEADLSLTIDEEKGELVFTFNPGFGYHLYGPDDTQGNIQIQVSPVEAEGVTWGKFSLPPAAQIDSPYTVRVPFVRADGTHKVEVKVVYQACSDMICAEAARGTAVVVWPDASGNVEPLPEPAPKVEVPQGEILFPVVEGDDLGQGESETTLLAGLMKDSPVLAFGFIFILGLGLAFTPCVLPIIPITVSVISGGNADIPRKRLAALLGIYVLGLCLTFATMGVVAAKTGGTMSALFAMPQVQWGIVVLFLFLGFGMFGVYELQPPAWLMKFQGGAQRRSGSYLGAFLFGCLGAIIASPCTGPAIAFLLIETAKVGSVVMGFSWFFILGLGMGAVLFAAGSLNFMMRPGPWMVWVRYSFGVLIIAAAMYYLRNYQLVDEPTMWIIGLVVCGLAAFGIAWHLNKKEGEAVKTARIRGAKVGVLTALSLVFVAWYTRVPDDLLSWTYADSPEHLRELVKESNKEGKPVVVDFWGTWCTNCKVYDKRIAGTPLLRQRFERITRIKVNLPKDDQARWPMRHALGIESSGAPIMVFIDREGQIRRGADVVGLMGAEDLAKHIDVVLRTEDPVKESASSNQAEPE